MATKLSFESRSLYRCLSIICCPWGGEGDFEALRGDFAIWSCCQAMNTQPLRTHTHTPESRLLSRALPSPLPCCQADVPRCTRAPARPPLSPHLPSLAMPGKSSFCSRPLSGGAWKLRRGTAASVIPRQRHKALTPCCCQVPAWQQQAEPSPAGRLRARWPRGGISW